MRILDFSATLTSFRRASLIAFSVFMVFMILVAASAQAHDYWLQPDRFTLPAREKVAVRLFVGDHFESQAERPYSKALTVDFRFFTNQKTFNLKDDSRDGKKPAGYIQPQSAGGGLVVLERDWSEIEIEAEKFNNYLKHEGLERILELRRKAGENKQAGRERYRRYLKALVHVGHKSDNAYARKVGHRLEITPLSNPAKSKPRDRLSFTVTFQGKPLPNAFVACYNRNAGKVYTQETRTDEKGVASFKIERSGQHLVRLVHMQRCKSSDDFDWESFWASYAFQREPKP